MGAAPPRDEPAGHTDRTSGVAIRYQRERPGELVTNSVVHAHTALELRVELRGARLQVAVQDQDPDLVGVLAAKEGTDRGLGLAIVDEVAKAWGVRRDGAGGKVVWCALDLPVPQAGPVGRRREPPA